MGDRCKYVSTVSSGAFDTVAVVDASFSCFVINVKILKVVIKVDASSTKVASEKSSMRCKNGRHVDMSLAT